MKQAGLGLFDLGDKMPALQGHTEIWEALSERRSVFSCSEVETLMAPNGYHFQRHPAPGFPTKGCMEDVFLYDIETYMAGQILVKTDRASMANGLELRAPFLDAEFADFALVLPSCLKISGSDSKIILRKAFEAIWNIEVATNRKRGFESPISEWLTTSSFIELSKTFLDTKQCKIKKLLNIGNLNHLNSRQKYCLLVLSLWMEENSFSLPNNFA
jgi:asparagine synthetase B (glutamine-hydrolysing)